MTSQYLGCKRQSKSVARAGSVISPAGIGPEAWIDGFTITNGAGQDIGGGIIAGGGLFLNDSDLTLSNSIITGNTATSGNGSALYSEKNCLPVVTNSIFWANTGSPIHDLDGSTTTVGYSTIQGGWPGSGNLDSDPQFLDASGQNFRLHPDSACIDAGTNPAVPVQVDTDLDGNPRFAARHCDSIFDVDMGCFEFSRLRIGDFNDDCKINLVDFSIFSANWATADPLTDIAPAYRDGIVDLADLSVLVKNWLTEFE